MSQERTPKPCRHCGEIPRWDEFDWWLHDSENADPPPCMYYNDDDDDACYGGWEQDMHNYDLYNQLEEAYWAGKYGDSDD